MLYTRDVTLEERYNSIHIELNDKLFQIYDTIVDVIYGVEDSNGYHGRPATTSVTVHLKRARSSKRLDTIAHITIVPL